MEIKTVFTGLAAVSVALLMACSTGQNLQATDTVDSQLQQPIATAESLAGMVAGLSGLDDLKGTTEIQNGVIDVTTPLVQRHTAVSGEFLEFAPQNDEIAFAVYRIDPPVGAPLSVDGTCEGPLWLMVADYGTGRWVYAPFESGAASIDLTQLGNVLSPQGYIYAGVVCGAEDQGTLHSLRLHYDDLVPWNLQLTTAEDSVTLTWGELAFSSYEIYRSTLPDDPAPYLVGTVVEEHSGGNSFTEVVPEDNQGRWVPENNDNGTPADTTDDFPTVAPAVDYYYRIKAVLAEQPGLESPEVSGQIPWGDRSTIIRTLPDSTNQTRVFGYGIDAGSLTTAQLEWMADNMVGSTALIQSQIDVLREHNPDFVVAGAQLGFFSSPNIQTYHGIYTAPDGGHHYPQIYGEEVNYDGDYPYLTQHEDWYLHDEASQHPSNRVLSSFDAENDRYWMEMESSWPDYLTGNLRQLLGEDGFDGWMIESCTPNQSFDPMIFGELYQNPEIFAYVSGICATLLDKLHTGFTSHAKQPMLIADAWIGYDALEGEYGYLDYSACDTVLYSGFLWGSGGNDSAGMIWEFTNILGDEILRQQAAGQHVIMHHWVKDAEAPMTAFGCYMLVRGPASYLYLSEYYDQRGLLNWYPMLSWDSGAPLDTMPEKLSDLQVQSDDPAGNPIEGCDYYRRDFENGFMLVVPQYMALKMDAPVTLEWLECTGGGAVEDDGSTHGTAEWKPCNLPVPKDYLMIGEPGCYIFRVVDEP